MEMHDMKKYNIKLKSKDGRDWDVKATGNDPDEAAEKALAEAQKQQPRRVWAVVWAREL